MMGERMPGYKARTEVRIPDAPEPSRPSICAHILAHLPPTGPGLTPGGDILPDEATLTGLPLAPGALDGVLSHHGQDTDNRARVADVLDAWDRAAWPLAARSALQLATRNETDDTLRGRLARLARGEPAPRS